MIDRLATSLLGMPPGVWKSQRSGVLSGDNNTGRDDDGQRNYQYLTGCYQIFNKPALALDRGKGLTDKWLSRR